MVVCILKKTCQLKKGVIFKRYRNPLLQRSNEIRIFCFVLSYCHPNLPNREYEEYTNSLEHIYGYISKENSIVAIVIRDFNGRSPYVGDTTSRTAKDEFLAIC